MGLFSGLFGSSAGQANTAQGVRALHKDAKYFTKEIQRFQTIIDDAVQQLEQQPPASPDPFQYWSVAVKYQRLAALRYSCGAPVADCASDYNKALQYYVKGWDEQEATYADMLSMTAMAVLFEVPDAAFAQLVEYIDKTESNPRLSGWKPDALLGLMLHYRTPARPVPATLLVPQLYAPLYNAAQLPPGEAEAAVAAYLDAWYALHKDEPWYNTHLKEKGYAGYWAWEAAAVVKMMKLDDTSFKTNPYYPYDLVHWKD